MNIHLSFFKSWYFIVVDIGVHAKRKANKKHLQKMKNLQKIEKKKSFLDN